MNPAPLTTAPKVTLLVQCALAIGFALLVVLTSGGSGGWADLARFAGLLLGGVYLLGVAIAWALARFVARGTALRVTAALVTPPLVLVIALQVLRAVN